jgi:hypothetical protein
MKKIMLLLAIVTTTLSSFAGETVNEKVLKSFKSDFGTAKEVVWAAGDNYYKATFKYNEKFVFAYYNTDGLLLAITRYLSPADLPMNLQTKLKKDFGEYWISDLFEVAKDSGTFYFITLENADSKVILKAENGSDWAFFSKTKKS